MYNIICDSLGIEPRPNNGTLRLPLKPIGFHSDETNEQNEKIDDLKEDFSGGIEVSTTVHVSISVPQASAPAVSVATAHEATNKSLSNATINNTINDHDLPNQSNLDSSFWDFLTEKLEAIKAWAESKFSKQEA